MSTQDPIIGIDLGTSNSCAAFFDGRGAEIIRNGHGDRTTPSMIAFDAEDRLLVGAAARRQAILNPTSTFGEIKRLIGRSFDDPEVQAAINVLPFRVVRGPSGDAWVEHGGRQLSPPEIQAYVLERLRRSARAYLNCPVSRAVITVPAFFDETERQAVRDAATIAGLEAVRIVSEPTAAALAYGYANFQGVVVVVDLGGGTLDVTVMSIQDNRFQVLATGGDTLLGGADFDRAIAHHLAESIAREHEADVFDDPIATQRLLAEAESSKIALTSLDPAYIQLPYLLDGPRGPVNFNAPLTRIEYDRIVSPLVERIVAPCLETLRAASLTLDQVDDVLLVGGMTRSPVIRRRVADLFRRKPSLRANPDEVVASGAALVGACIAGHLPEAVLVDVAPRTLGIATVGDRYTPLIRAATPLPAVAQRRFSTTQPGQTSFDIVILQGENPVASQNRRLARVELAPIPGAPAGQVFVDVTFTLDDAGQLHVQAVESTQGRTIDGPVRAFSGLGESQVERLAAELASRKRRADTAEDVFDGEAGAASSSSDGFTIEFK